MLQTLSILPQIGPNHFPFLIVPLASPGPVHLSVQPLALVFVELAFTDTIASDGVVRELTLIVGTVGIGETAFAILGPGGEGAAVD